MAPRIGENAIDGLIAVASDDTEVLAREVYSQHALELLALSGNSKNTGRVTSSPTV